MRKLTLSLLLICCGCLSVPALNAGCKSCIQNSKNNQYNASSNNYFYYEDYQQQQQNNVSR